MAVAGAGTSDSCGIGTKISVSDEKLLEKRDNADRSIEIIPIMDRVIDNFKSKIRYSMFAKHFPKLHKEDRPVLRTARTNFVTNVTTRIRAGVQELSDECNIAALLAEMNEMSASQPSTDKNGPIRGWRPSGNPSKDISAHLMAAKLEMVDRMKKKLVDMRKRRDKLTSDNIETCKNLVQLQEKLDKHLKKFDAATTAIQQIPNDGIDKFTSFYESENDSRNMKREKTKEENA